MSVKLLLELQYESVTAINIWTVEPWFLCKMGLLHQDAAYCSLLLYGGTISGDIQYKNKGVKNSGGFLVRTPTGVVSSYSLEEKQTLT